VRRYSVDVHKRKCSAIKQSADLLVDGIDPHLWIHGIVEIGCFGSKYMMYNAKTGSGYTALVVERVMRGSIALRAVGELFLSSMS
jgi:hypothetical protein